jgi:hypothetical protein
MFWGRAGAERLWGVTQTRGSQVGNRGGQDQEVCKTHCGEVVNVCPAWERRVQGLCTVLRVCLEMVLIQKDPFTTVLLYLLYTTKDKKNPA